MIAQTASLFASGAPGGASFELLAPWGLALGALLAPLVVLYILKIQRKRRVISSTWLWATAQRDLLARSPFKRFVAQVPLVLQAIALLALAFALARPATRGREFAGDHVAIVLDASASMSADALDDKGKLTTRIGVAKEVAKGIVGSLAPGSDVMVLEAGKDARLVAPLDRDAIRTKQAIDRAAVRDVEGDLGAAVALAVDRMRQLGGRRRIVVITDGNLAHPDALQGASLPLEVVLVGGPVDNAAIVRVDVRSGNDPATQSEQVQGFLVVANFGQKPRDLYVTMREEGQSDALASRRVLVQPGERLPVQLTFRPSQGDYRKGLVFALSPHDSMSVDDEAYGRVPAGDKLPVYVAGPSPWLERAIRADPMIELKVGTPADLAPGAVGLDTFVVIHGACPAQPPGGDLLLIDPPPGRCFGTMVGRSLDHPLITSWENGDARLRFLTLDGVHVAKANSLKPEAKNQELIRSQEDALATDVSTPTRTGTLLGFDPGESDWPLKASFVLFVRNLLEQARAHRAHGVTGPAHAGEPLRVSVPASAEKVEATGPGGEKLEVSMRGGLAVVPEITHVGFYHVSWQGPEAGSVVVPANLTSVAESDLSPKPLSTEAGKLEVATAAEPDAHHEWTWILALVALAFVLFDVWYYTRDIRAIRPAIAQRAIAKTPPKRKAGP